MSRLSLYATAFGFTRRASARNQKCGMIVQDIMKDITGLKTHANKP